MHACRHAHARAHTHTCTHGHTHASMHINTHTHTHTQGSSKVCCLFPGIDDLEDKVDFIICLGGDGTLLYASSLFQVLAVFMCVCVGGGGGGGGITDIE